MSKNRTFVECLRSNIKDNWNEGGLFESMTKDDCLDACDKIEQLQAKLDKAKEQYNQLWLDYVERGRVLEDWKEAVVLSDLDKLFPDELADTKKALEQGGILNE